jgi:hypothetical protein
MKAQENKYVKNASFIPIKRIERKCATITTLLFDKHHITSREEPIATQGRVTVAYIRLAIHSNKKNETTFLKQFSKFIVRTTVPLLK